MAESRLIPIDETAAWHDALAGCGQFDTYHLPGYHRVAMRQREGEPWLFAFQDDVGHAALPLLLRSIGGEVDGLDDCQWCDATSSYGYPGLLSSVDRKMAGATKFRDRFQAALREAMSERNVISLFVRQHPLLETSWLFEGITRPITHGETVAIDLTRPEEEQLGDYRNNHRRDIRRARQEGMTCDEDLDFSQIESFRRLYEETMDRTGAADYYYFSPQYYADLKSELGDAARLWLSRQDGQIVSGALFLVTDGIVQYHLGGTASRFQELHGGIKLIFDEVRSWGAQNGLRWLHLGGGLGADADSLFDFKAGFSNTRFEFHTARAVLHPQAYRTLVRQKTQWLSDQEMIVRDIRYFPAYRQSGIRRAA